MVAEQPQSAIGSYEQPNRRTWTSFLEDVPVGDPGAGGGQRVSRVMDRAVGQQRGESVPQRFQQPFSLLRFEPWTCYHQQKQPPGQPEHG